MADAQPPTFAAPSPPDLPRLATTALAWRAESRDALMVRPVGITELGPASRGELVLADQAGDRAGTLLRGAADPSVAELCQGFWAEAGGDDGDDHRHRVLPLPVDTDDAVAAGLTCGGVVELLIQRLAEVPTALWDEVAADRTALLATGLDGPGAGRSLVLTPDGTVSGTLGDADLDHRVRDEGDRLVRSPGGGSVQLHVGGSRVLLETWNPAPRLLVVGAVALSDALGQLCALLGWLPTVTTEVDDSVAAVSGLGPNDMVLVVEHRPSVAAPVLATALRRRVGYVGALGSRRTQVARRNALRNDGVTDAEMEALYGPAGLDLGGRSPVETAISIVAEIIAVRGGRNALPLRVTDAKISA